LIDMSVARRGWALKGPVTVESNAVYSLRRHRRETHRTGVIPDPALPTFRPRRHRGDQHLRCEAGHAFRGRGPAGARDGVAAHRLGRRRAQRTLVDRFGAPDAAYEVGDVVQFPRPDGEPGYAGMVREVGDDWLLFDFNHPLAGQSVTFEVQVIEVL
jgi:hypothetical protein